MWNSFSTANGVSAKTIRRVLHKYGIRCRSAAKITAIRPKTALNRIQWCNQRKTWSVAYWKRRIMFTDEVRCRLSSDGRVTPVWRGNSKRFDPHCVVSDRSTDKQSIMFRKIVRSDGQNIFLDDNNFQLFFEL